MSLLISKKEGLSLYGVWTFEVRENGKLIDKQVKKNLVPTVGLAAIAAQFGNTAITTDIGDNLYVALGDDNTAPNAADTTLGNEVTRKAVSDRNSTSATANISTFFATGEATGTHLEVGLFGDGDTTTASATPDSGILYSHTNINVTITAAQTLTVSYNLTFA